MLQFCSTESEIATFVGMREIMWANVCLMSRLREVYRLLASLWGNSNFPR